MSNQAILYVLMAIFVPLNVALLFVPAGCGNVARVATPISSSHSQITPTEYDLAEAEFGGGLMPMPAEFDRWTDARCQELLDRRDALVISAATLGGITGAGGLATLVPKDATAEERKEWDLGLGISTLVSGATASTLMLVAKTLTERYEQNCRTEKPVPAEHPASDEEPRAEGVRSGSLEPVDGGVE
jgi:hypothetical protein